MALKIKEEIKTLPSGEIECMCEGCTELAKYRAPKSPEYPGEYYYFCLKHVREYNKSWDFFSGKSQKEIERFQKESLAGHRRTRPAGVSEHARQQKVEEELAKIFSRVNRRKEQIHYSQQLTEEHRDALAILKVDSNASWEVIKASYKSLAKSHHPDINTESDGEMFKRINQAYSILKAIYQTV